MRLTCLLSNSRETFWVAETFVLFSRMAGRTSATKVFFSRTLEKLGRTLEPWCWKFSISSQELKGKFIQNMESIPWSELYKKLSWLFQVLQWQWMVVKILKHKKVHPNISQTNTNASIRFKRPLLTPGAVWSNFYDGWMHFIGLQNLGWP